MKLLISLIIFTLFSNPGFSKDAMDCANINHPAYQDEYRACLRLNIKTAASAQGVDCDTCFEDVNEKSSNSFVAALGAIAQPAAVLLATYTTVKSQNQIQERWAKAFEAGNTECTNRYNSFLNYNTTIGANSITPAEAQSLNTCNGYGYGGYAGYGGMTGNMYGGFGNPFLQNGFTSGYLSGFNGMYGAGTYGTGMISGSIGIGTAGTTSSSVYQSGITPAFGF